MLQWVDRVVLCCSGLTGLFYVAVGRQGCSMLQWVDRVVLCCSGLTGLFYVAVG